MVPLRVGRSPKQIRRCQIKRKRDAAYLFRFRSARRIGGEGPRPRTSCPGIERAHQKTGAVRRFFRRIRTISSFDQFEGIRHDITGGGGPSGYADEIIGAL